MTCARKCVHFKKHLNSCPVDDRKSGTWVNVPLDDERRTKITDNTPDDLLAMLGLNRNRWGGLEEWLECRGCVPRQAEHGSLCEQCHTRLVAWFAGGTKGSRWLPAEGSLAWAYDWLAADREPRQATAGADKIRQGKKVPPAALALPVHDLREDITKRLGEWLRHTTQQFDLTGPDWWAHRTDQRSYQASSWRSWLPQDQREVTDAQRYLNGWLGRIEAVPDLAVMVYREADELMRRVAAIAPWKAEGKRMPGLSCPSCDRDALALYSGEESLQCRRCGTIVGRETYDRWAFHLASTKADKAAS